jgi:pimeloyl-ACP methyl ester carboxylesterase
MTRERTRRLLLWLVCIGIVAVPPGIDLAFTLAFQPASYWSGDWSTALEGSLVFAWAMRLGPAAALIVTFVWVVAVGTLLAWVARFPAQLLWIAVVIGNSFGAMSWAAFTMRSPLVVAMILVCNAVVALVGLRLAGRARETRG